MSTPPAAAAPAFSDYEAAVCAHAEYYSALAAREGPRLNGAGKPDKGRAQMYALHSLKLELENVYSALDTALNRGALDWLLPLAEHLGSLLENSGQLLAMQQRYGVLVGAARQLASPQLELHAQLGLSRALWRQGNLAEAVAASEAALSVSGALGDGPASAQALNTMGTVHLLRGAFDRAQELYAQSLDVMQRRGDELGVANTLGNMGIVHWQRGELDLALELHAQSLEAKQRLGDELGAARTLGNMGIVHRQRGELDRALELYALSLDVEQRLGDELGAAGTLGNMGNVHLQSGELDRALELFTQCLEVQQRLGDELGAAVTLDNMCTVHRQRGELGRARELYAKSLEVRRRLGAKTRIAESCANTAVALAGLGRLRPAALVLHGALARANELGYRFDDQARIDACLARLAAAVASGEVSADELAQWKSEGEALSLDELAEFTLTALEESGD